MEGLARGIVRKKEWFQEGSSRSGRIDRPKKKRTEFYRNGDSGRRILGRAVIIGVRGFVAGEGGSGELVGQLF